MEYRNHITAQVLTYAQLQQAHPNTYIPANPTAEYMSALGYDIVQEVVPERTQYHEVVRNGIEQKADGKWYQKWATVPWTAALIAEHEANLAAEAMATKKGLAVRIDDAVANRIIRSTRFSMEYTEREAAAQAYKDAGYTGNPSDWVTRFANNAEMSYIAAADLILAQAIGLRQALKELACLRMDKYLVLNASTLDEAQAKFNKIMADIEAVVIP